LLPSLETFDWDKDPTTDGARDITFPDGVVLEAVNVNPWDLSGPDTIVGF
jgi:hypothetical protein